MRAYFHRALMKNRKGSKSKNAENRKPVDCSYNNNETKRNEIK